MKTRIEEVKAEKTYPLRLEILRKNIPLPHKFIEDDVKTTFHFAIYLEEELVGIVTAIKKEHEFFANEEITYQLRAMAISKECQGKGIGKILLESALEELLKKGISQIWLKAREHAIDFYKKIGFKEFGEVYDVKFVGNHKTMVIQL
ncbi:GNAT family N-acetyltransferase [Aureivirga marina]|uniref:GNAT family N-acetyltransferase n=1 Tax=Aureivirga marina TaxID=1182451 RepID=UPI0018CA05DB|nr:GNAT family N-acetyltransferase [Aureivirga marina]